MVDGDAFQEARRRYIETVYGYAHPVDAARSALLATWPLLWSGISSAPYGNRGSPERRFAAQLFVAARRGWRSVAHFYPTERAP